MFIVLTPGLDVPSRRPRPARNGPQSRNRLEKAGKKYIVVHTFFGQYESWQV